MIFPFMIEDAINNHDRTRAKRLDGIRSLSCLLKLSNFINNLQNDNFNINRARFVVSATPRIGGGPGLVAHSFYSSELIKSDNAWAKRLQADYSLRALSNFIGSSARGEIFADL
jgi:hypothetical protein